MAAIPVLRGIGLCRQPRQLLGRFGPQQRIEPDARTFREGSRGQTQWIEADVLPIIADNIRRRIGSINASLRAEIAGRLLQDSEGRNLVEAAREQQQDQQSLEWLASNMVSWFSQRITVGESDWRGRSSGPKSRASGRTSLSRRATHRRMPMGQLFDTIRQLVAEEKYVVGEHASERLEERGIMEWQVVAGLEDWRN